MNFQIACGIVARDYGYKDWKELLKEEKGTVHYYQLAADMYAEFKLTEYIKSLKTKES